MFLHIGINFRDEDSNLNRILEIERVLNQGSDWLRYAPNCWILYTNQNPTVWIEKILAIPFMQTEKRHFVFICELDWRNKAGLLSAGIWEWINREREASGDAPLTLDTL
jgi:hypothetical protein